MHLYGGWISDTQGGRAVIVNECHRLDGSTIARILDAIEPVPNHVVWCFTTTWDGQERLFEREIDAEAFSSRCISIALTNQGTAQPFAARAREIAQSVGMNGQPESAYLALVRKHRGNFRAVLRDIEAGCMSQ
jgi:hypothetical protein